MDTATATSPQTTTTAGSSPPVPTGKGSRVEGTLRPPPPRNETVLDYAPGSRERRELKAVLERMSGEEIEIPVIVGGEEMRTAEVREVVMPHDHGHVLARCHQVGAAEVAAAVEAAREGWSEWSSWGWEDRVAVFLRAAELLAGPWRATVNAATMLGQSKTVHQAEIDSACELADFWRFNCHYAARIYEEQPESAAGMWNRLDHRSLEGFVYAISPFNFSSIAGNLPTAPAIMGNVTLWKPAAVSVLSSYYIMRLLEAAGLPPGVINFIPGPSSAISRSIVASPELAGIHFTGSTEVFRLLWRAVAENLEAYRSYPRLVGETGGKDFIVAHRSADPEALAVAIGRGAFEYQGQKCSAASRVYVPENLWPDVRERVLEMVAEIRVGDPADFRNFMAAVIDRAAFEKITSYIDHARESEADEILAGGGSSAERGWFIDPTVVVTEDPGDRLMREEIFGPVVTIYPYRTADWEETLRLVNETSPYGLTGAVFATDRSAIRQATALLRHAAGNFYINDKPTGAVVGQQPFGGGRASGTNDKAGSALNLLRWVSPRTIKETFDPPREWRYPFMEGE
ncbi:MAG: L-glutamate gamma-semialdehyde dehydrogenase [Gemmatimonadota bacterium]